MTLVIKTTGSPLWDEVYEQRVRARITAKSTVDVNGCWLWGGYIRKDGYGQVAVRTRRGNRCVSAYRVAYMAFVGPIPDGLDLDHLCRVHACVNPAHLEPVTRRENLARGDTRWAIRVRTGRCIDVDHDLTLPGALTPQGRCRECWNAYMRGYHKRVSA